MISQLSMEVVRISPFSARDGPVFDHGISELRTMKGETNCETI